MCSPCMLLPSLCVVKAMSHAAMNKFTYADPEPEPEQQLPLPLYPTIRQPSGVPVPEYQSIESTVGSPPTDRHRSESSRQVRMDTPQLQQLREEMRQMITDSLQAFQNQQHAMSRPLKPDEVGLFFLILKQTLTNLQTKSSSTTSSHLQTHYSTWLSYTQIRKSGKCYAPGSTNNGP
jgi:hypothetical protein